MHVVLLRVTLISESHPAQRAEHDGLEVVEFLIMDCQTKPLSLCDVCGDSWMSFSYLTPVPEDFRSYTGEK